MVHSQIIIFVLILSLNYARKINAESFALTNSSRHHSSVIFMNDTEDGDVNHVDMQKTAITRNTNESGLNMSSGDDNTPKPRTRQQYLRNVMNRAGQRGNSDGADNASTSSDIWYIIIIESERAWDKPLLTYRISKYPVQLYPNRLTEETVDEAIFRATEMWSNVSNINFTQVRSDSNSVDIDIIFDFFDRDESCNNTYDADVLAHQVIINGTEMAIHFNGRVTWTVDRNDFQTDEYDLVSIAAHEFGHALGIKHIENTGAVMYKAIGKDVRRLTGDDIRIAQRLYGPRHTPALSKDTNNTSWIPLPIDQNRCDSYFGYDIFTDEVICANVYSGDNCNGNIAEERDGANGRILQTIWDNKISSVEVNRNCILKLCKSINFSGACIDLSSGIYRQLPAGYENTVSSLACHCFGRGRDQDDVGLDLERVKAVPYYFPLASFKKTRSCAVFVERFKKKSKIVWMTIESVSAMPTDFDVPFTYIVTAANCGLIYCTEQNFSGRCYSLGWNQYIDVASMKKIFIVKSAICACHIIE